MKKILFITAVLFGSAANGQVTVKKDTTIVLKTDEYNNGNTARQAYPISKTIGLDSIENSNLAAQRKTTMAPLNYLELAAKADSLYNIGAYAAAANLYGIAFKRNNDWGQVKHRYNAACCYARLQQNNSSFFQLYIIAEKGNYYNYKEIESEKCFEPLYSDARWSLLIKIIKHNADKVADKLNSEIINKD